MIGDIGQFLGTIETKRKLTNNQLEKNFPNAKNGDSVLNIVKGKKKTKGYYYIKVNHINFQISVWLLIDSMDIKIEPEEEGK